MVAPSTHGDYDTIELDPRFVSSFFADWELRDVMFALVQCVLQLVGAFVCVSRIFGGARRLVLGAWPRKEASFPDIDIPEQPEDVALLALRSTLMNLTADGLEQLAVHFFPPRKGPLSGKAFITDFLLQKRTTSIQQLNMLARCAEDGFGFHPLALLDKDVADRNLIYARRWYANLSERSR